MAKQKTRKTQRTETLLEGFRGNPDEFVMLKGVLCMALGLDYADEQKARSLFDTKMIAARMDAMNAAAIKEAKELLARANSATVQA